MKDQPGFHSWQIRLWNVVLSLHIHHFIIADGQRYCPRCFSGYVGR